ncbi:sodium:calcium antiporter [Halobacillus sp. Marseille-Q1614]|uniref:sodium:calcium antiporter n=1 Tax=Halobacillus sp. Marseille-Q1614 TaxID=2709134 RepID=UPI00156E3179|nr:sodium:calcium antiporter [Halobacillus sp. Marseille-Q1614]
MSVWLIFMLFILSGIGAFFAASRLAYFGDAVKEKTTATSAFMGMLIGVAISLPELTSSVTSIIIDAPDLAVGNLVGSNLFNILALAIFDLVYRKHQIMTHATVESKLYGWLVILLTFIVLLGLILPVPAHLFNVGYTSIGVILIYAIATKWINERTEYKGRKIKRKPKRYKEHSFRQSIWQFILAAAAIMVMGSILTITAEEIATITGLGASFVGSFLVAISTSLPDAVSVGTALKMRNYNLAISSLLGSNAFNLIILAFTDIFYIRGRLLEQAGPSNLITGGVSIGFILLIIYSISRRRAQPAWSYMLPSSLIVVSYFVTTYFVFAMR